MTKSNDKHRGDLSLRHTVATLAYRGGKVLRKAPAEFSEFRAGEGAAFGPAIAADDALSDFDRVLLHLGRLPAWAPR